MIKNSFCLFKLVLAYCLILTMSCKKNNLERSDEVLRKNVSAFSVAGNLSYSTTIGTNVQEFKELGYAEQDRARILTNMDWTDFEATGIYVSPNTTLNLTVEQLEGTHLPILRIGTVFRPGIIRDVKLVAGINTIPTGENSGLLWIKYTTTETPGGKVRITFNSGHQRAAVFLKNITTQADWDFQLATYTAPDVVLIGNRIIQVYSRALAQSLQPQDNNFVLTTADKIWDAENEISGLDGSAPEHQLPVHNRMLMVHYPGTDVGWYGAATVNATGYYLNAAPEIFTPKLATPTGFGAWHELGHEHQQHAWYSSALVEVSVNIYALKAERALGIFPSRLKRDNNIWPAILKYLDLDAPDKDFYSTKYQAPSYNFVRLAMYQQLWLAYGDAFFIKLHKKTRIEKPIVVNDFDATRYFMLSACQLTGHNLTNFFKKWAFKTSYANNASVSLESVYTEIANLNLPVPIVEPSALTEDNTTIEAIKNGGIYKIVSAINNSNVIGFGSPVPSTPTAVRLWTDNDGNNKKWLARSTGDGYFVFKSMADTTKVMNANLAFGSHIGTAEANGSAGQKWNPVSQGNSYFTISPAANNLVFDVLNSSTANSTIITLADQNGGNAQKFKFKKIN